ncbi:hypothetical protein GCM10022288_13390 [Gryllotalpicola kribbensis]|uniref:Glycosyl transferase family 1 domain-containing protein n=1 Tax=Gryllotalpicola kribbensis TaxID=993084 RepID=A0ABP8AQW3_9MICO
MARLETRLKAAAAYIIPNVSEAPVAQLLEDCCTTARDSGDAHVWLLFIAVSGALPTEAELQALRRALSLAPAGNLGAAALRTCAPVALAHHSQLRTLDLRSGLVSLVDFSARHGFTSGVQRFTREVSRRWSERANVTFVAFNDDPSALRHLSADERMRLVDWSSERATEESQHRDNPWGTVVVPWKATLFLPEVPQYGQSPVLAALARFSGNRVVAFGHDMIPIASASELRLDEPLRFGSYLTVLRHATEVVANSATSAEEFRGYVGALHAQGLEGPAVSHLLLPVERLSGTADQLPLSERAMVLAVGSHEPRKNQIALVYAAEQLWREGLSFELRLLGGRGPRNFTVLRDAISALQLAKRPITVENDVSDAELAAAYRAARFSAFISLDEGYGLPVAESLASGTPVLTTNYGSTAEIASGGGCVLVDPRDDEAIVDSLRRMLTDDRLITQLRAEALARDDDTWDSFSQRLWERVTLSEARS